MQQRSAFVAVIAIFFFWGFMAASNGIFIPFCKSHFQLSQFQSQLIDSTFYGGYFIGSLLLFLYHYVVKIDFVNRFGYAKSFSYGLLVSAVGALCMIPSLHAGSYVSILGSFFIIALGFSLQQTAANPFVILLGDKQTGAHRLNLAGGINSLGTTIGPLVVALFLFGGLFKSDTAMVEMKNVDVLYVILAVLFTLLAWVIRTVKMREEVQTETQPFSLGALKYPQLAWGMGAIFIYVGVEVTIQSNMGALLLTPEYGSVSDHMLAPYISLYWGSLMIGRWAGSADVLASKPANRNLLLFLLPVQAYAVVFGINYFKSASVPGLDLPGLFLPYFLFVILMILITYFTHTNSANMLLAFALAATGCMVAGLLTSGNLSVLFFLSGGLWCSVMWPCIFALAIHRLGTFTSQASALLIMMILGGAVIPPLQGWLADTYSIKYSYVLAPLCFMYLAAYAWKFRHLQAEKSAAHA